MTARKRILGLVSSMAFFFILVIRMNWGVGVEQKEQHLNIF